MSSLEVGGEACWTLRQRWVGYFIGMDFCGCWCFLEATFEERHVDIHISYVYNIYIYIYVHIVIASCNISLFADWRIKHTVNNSDIQLTNRYMYVYIYMSIYTSICIYIYTHIYTNIRHIVWFSMMCCIPWFEVPIKHHIDLIKTCPVSSTLKNTASWCHFSSYSLHLFFFFQHLWNTWRLKIWILK